MDTQTENQETEAPAPFPFDEVSAASAQAEVERNTTIVMHKVSTKLTTEERSDLGDRLVALGNDIESRDITLREHAAVERAVLKEMRAREKALREEWVSGVGAVSVECRRTPIYERNCWQISRVDTGEVVDEQPMDADDKQPALPFVDDDTALDDAGNEIDLGDDADVADLERDLVEMGESIISGTAVTEPGELLDLMANAPATDEHGLPTETPKKRGRKAKG